MGFKGDVLRAQYHPDKISERKASMAVTVTNTRERQEAIAAANTHGAKFFVMGGEHVTSNNMFIVAKINRQKAEATEREKEKKSWVEYHTRPHSPSSTALSMSWTMTLGGWRARS